MKTKLHDVYVSRELALLLKKAGFDWKCRGFFDDTGFHDGSVECTNYNSNTCKYLKAPTLDVAQRWLREVKSVHIEIIVGDHSSDWGYYLCTDIYKPDNMPIINGVPKMSKFYDGFKSYEEAQEAGIKKTLEMILEERK